MDTDRARLPLDLYPLPRKITELFAADLERRVHRRDLQNLPGEPGSGLPHLRFGHLHRMFRHHRPGDIEGIGFQPQPKDGSIPLILIRQKITRLGCAAQKQRKHAGCHRVERARMADPARLGDPPQLCHHIKRGEALRLVDA